MPFDSADTTSKTELFRKRREDAANLWQSIPPACFKMTAWECDSAACALGWLAILQHDGWAFDPHSPLMPYRVPHYAKFHGYAGAAQYFGISLLNAERCFGYSKATVQFHRRWFVSRITPKDVSKSLLALSYDPAALQ